MNMYANIKLFIFVLYKYKEIFFSNLNLSNKVNKIKSYYHNSIKSARYRNTSVVK